MLLNVSFGIFAFMPQGWLFMAAVILLEGLLLARLLTGHWVDKQFRLLALYTNAVSGVVGILASMKLNGGWWLVVWFPWVSNNEIDLSQPNAARFLALYYAAAFILTLVLEALFNVWFLRRDYPRRRVLTATLLANVVSYAIGSAVLYAYSFS
ncbi:hypothetical protein EJV47_24780 [Hymenobacter gummosus]|uniref:Uncharacterized protein n=1 Tax=Hymenobacter gummosus TaxID=1776032 RepID=A0A3S0J697_9BACT|nr:hypothetical protein [Hymenobacter gummosus]RTQ45704.1 hypothetical protein EJV47_24780 [Hymenobacter gummosus]